jgi:mono/diheme cytochrome c family protein
VRPAFILAAVIVLCGLCGCRPRPSPGEQIDAISLFNNTCAKCHGEDGHADTPQGKLVGAKDLTRDEARRMTDADITRQIREGKNRMPAFGQVFGDEEVKALVAHVRKIQKSTGSGSN